MHAKIKEFIRRREVKKAFKALGHDGVRNFKNCYKEALYYVNDGQQKKPITYRFERVAFSKELAKVKVYIRGECEEGEKAAEILEKILNFCNEVSKRSNHIRHEYLFDQSSFRDSPSFHAQNSDLYY